MCVVNPAREREAATFTSDRETALKVAFKKLLVKSNN